MYEDDPQDKVFDVLGEAVFGDHPLGRAIIGRAEVIARTPLDAIAAFHAARYVPGNVVVAAAGSVDHDALVALVERLPAGRATGKFELPGSPPERAEPRGALREQGHRAVPRLPWARPASPATTSAASRCACSTTSSAAPRRRACSRRCASSAGWPTACTRSPASTPTRARSGCTSARGRTTSAPALDVVGSELERLRVEPATAEELRAQQGERQGPASCSRSSRPPPRMNRLGSSVLTRRAAAVRRRAGRAHRRA